MAMITRFWTPANVSDLADAPAEQEALNACWNASMIGFTQQGILGDPWNSANQSNQTSYFDPLAEGPSDPAAYTVTPVQWSPLPGRIGHYFPGLVVSQKPTADYYALADTGHDTRGNTFAQIVNDPCVALMGCTGATHDQPYGPYGPRGWQDEYCEWAVTRGAPTDRYPLGPILRIDFTCENPEYWSALWLVDPGRVVALYRSTLGKPQIEEADLYLHDPTDPTGKKVVTDPSTGRPAYNPLNKWNTGTVSTATQGGAMHLTSTPNTLQTEIQLGAGATVQRVNGATYSADKLLCCGQYGQVARNSDPNIGQGVNGLVGATPPPSPFGSKVSLANPAGLYIQPPDWTQFTTPTIDGTRTPASTFWTIVRGASSLTDQNGHALPGQFILHATFEVPAEHGYTVSDILVNGANVVYAAQIVYTMQMHILAASYPATSAPTELPCVWCCTAAPAPSYAQPLQMFHAAVWDAMYPVMIPNPVGNPISLASNSTLIAPFVVPGRTYDMTLTVTGAAGTPEVTATLDGAPDPSIKIAVTGSQAVSYAVPGNSYPSASTALQLSVAVADGARPGMRGIVVTNPGDPAQAAMPALLNVVPAASQKAA
jgi:hypothetical protein